jgi:hypothetical protein
MSYKALKEYLFELRIIRLNTKMKVSMLIINLGTAHPYSWGLNPCTAQPSSKVAKFS